MPDTAKLFKSGGDQAVLLPEGCRFEGQDEVLIYKQGNRVILEPIRRNWSREFLDLAELADFIAQDSHEDVAKLPSAARPQPNSPRQ